MSRSKLPLIALVALVGAAALVAASCSSGGYQYWLYPEPRLPEPEEALFVAHETHRVLSIDGEELASACSERDVRPQAYDQNDRICNYHILPGQHSVAFQSSTTSMETIMLDFGAEPGKTYGLTWTGCGAYLDMDGHRKTCRVNVEEIKTTGGVG